jgi:DNA-binding IscR family transcriptional regulator
MFCLEPADHTCFQDSRCGLQELWGDVYIAVRRVFEQTSVATLAARHRRLAPQKTLIATEELIRPKG